MTRTSQRAMLEDVGGRVGLDNLEDKQDRWIRLYASLRNPPPYPQLNSPRSLAACDAAGVDPTRDLTRVSLREQLHRVLGDPAATTSFSSADAATRTEVMRFFQANAVGMGTLGEKLAAYQRYQVDEAHRLEALQRVRAASTSRLSGSGMLPPLSVPAAEATGPPSDAGRPTVPGPAEKRGSAGTSTMAVPVPRSSSSTRLPQRRVFLRDADRSTAVTGPTPDQRAAELDSNAMSARASYKTLSAAVVAHGAGHSSYVYKMPDNSVLEPPSASTSSPGSTSTSLVTTSHLTGHLIPEFREGAATKVQPVPRLPGSDGSHSLDRTKTRSDPVRYSGSLDGAGKSWRDGSSPSARAPSAEDAFHAIEPQDSLSVLEGTRGVRGAAVRFVAPPPLTVTEVEQGVDYYCANATS